MAISKTDKKKNGLTLYRVRVSYTDIYGEHKQIERRVCGLKEAKEVELKLLDSISTRRSDAPSTIGDLATEFLKVKQTEIRASSFRGLNGIFKRHIIPTQSNIRIQSLSPALMQKWKVYISGQELSLITKQKIYISYKAMLDYALKMEYISKNPLATIGNFKETLTEVKSMDFYTIDEFKTYTSTALGIAREKDSLVTWGFYVFFNLAFVTGARKGEINALRWCDIEDNVIKVTRSVSQKNGGGDAFTPPKNRSSIRDIKLPPGAVKLLSTHKERQRALPNFGEEFFICGGTVPSRDTSLSNFNKKVSSEAGLKTIRVHDFRHSHASYLASEGINIQEIARRLGHSNISETLNTYSHLYPKEEDRVLKVLDNLGQI